MLPPLANGLREGAKFDVLTLPFGDPGAAGAAQRADALAIFYGTPEQPVQVVLHSFAAVRARGGRVVAVLQRDQAAQRDDCFKAGASDLLFMPFPKEQFVSRLAASVALSYTPERGAPATVQVGARGNLVPLEQATVTTAGVHASSALPFQAGETVRLSWATFECWGLVARAGPEAQVRFAGLAPDEEARIREWIQKVTGVPAAPRPAVAPPASPAAPAAKPRTPPPPAMGAAAKPTVVASGAVQAPKVTSPRPPPGSPAPTTGRANVPAAPPPSSRPPAPTNAARPATGPAPSKVAPAATALFDDDAPAPAPPFPAGPKWPPVAAVDACKEAGIAFLHDKKPPAATTSDVAAAAKKVAGILSLGERNALEKAGPESHFAEAFAARIALELARGEAARLQATQPAPYVDDAAMRALTQIHDVAAARLQKEVEVAIGRADVETLQLLTLCNAALSRELLLFKEAADRLRGLASAPRLGAGSLDPDLVVAGQQYVRPPAKPLDRPAVRPELREFQGLGVSDGRSRRNGALFVCLLALGAALVNLIFFTYPPVKQLPANIPGVTRIEISGKVARVSVAANFNDDQARAVGMLTQALRERGVERAMLVRQNGTSAGQISIRDGKAFGLAAPVKRPDGALPTIPAQPPAPGAQPQPMVPARPQSASALPK